MEAQFGKLTISWDVFENCGVRHRQDPKTRHVYTDQSHYVTQLRPIADDGLHARMLREWLDRRLVSRIWWVDTRDMLSDALTKGAVNRDDLVRALNSALWVLRHAAQYWPNGQ